jgi:hypothetical protein
VEATPSAIDADGAGAKAPAPTYADVKRMKHELDFAPVPQCANMRRKLNAKKAAYAEALEAFRAQARTGTAIKTAIRQVDDDPQFRRPGLAKALRWLSPPQPRGQRGKLDFGNVRQTPAVPFRRLYALEF